MLHGLGGHSDRFQECATLWSSRGISVYAIDLPGFGRSDGPKGDIDSFELYQRQIETLLARVMAENSRRPVFLLGESMGGVLAVNFASRRPALLSGLLLLAPAFMDRLNVSPWRQLEALLNKLIGRRKYYDVPWNPHDFTRDEEVIARLDADPLEVRRVTGQFYFAYLPVARRARRAASRLHLPVLLLLPGDDRLIESEYTRGWFERLPATDRTLREYPGYYHALLLEKDRPPILNDVADWILQRA